MITPLKKRQQITPRSNERMRRVGEHTHQSYGRVASSSSPVHYFRGHGIVCGKKVSDGVVFTPCLRMVTCISCLRLL